jgi:hypothetical protein
LKFYCFQLVFPPVAMAHPMSKSVSMILEGGLLKLNVISGYRLQGDAAEVFRAAAQKCNQNQPAYMFLREVWPTIMACDTTDDSRILALLETAMRNTWVLKICKRASEQHIHWLSFKKELARCSDRLSPDVRTFAECQSQLALCGLALTMEASEMIQTGCYQELKEMVRLTTSLTNPEFPTSGLLAYAWNIMLMIFLQRQQLPASIKAAKRTLAFSIRCIAETNVQPAVEMPVESLLRELMDRASLLKFTEKHVQNAYELMTADCGQILLANLSHLINIVSVEHQCCIPTVGPFPTPCPIHGESLKMLPLPPSLKELLVHYPECIHPTDQRLWLTAMQGQLNGKGSRPPETEAGEVFSLATRLATITLMATLDELMGFSPSGLLPRATLRAALNPFTAYHWHSPSEEVGDDLSSVKAYLDETMLTWAITCNHHFEQRGLNVTLAELLARYAQLDKNEIQGLNDYELLTKLGLSGS